MMRVPYHYSEKGSGGINTVLFYMLGYIEDSSRGKNRDDTQLIWHQPHMILADHESLAYDSGGL